MKEQIVVRNHLDLAVAALSRIVGERGEARVTLLLDDPNIASFGPFDCETTLAVEDHANGSVGMVCIGRRRCGVVDLTVAGITVEPTFDLVEPASATK